MVYPQFMGRLGNNMFQIAASIGYAEKYDVEWGIPKGFIEPGFRVFQVDQFMPHLPSHKDVHYKRWDEPNYDYTEIPFHPEGVRIVGYFQSIKYFEHCQQKVKDAIMLPYHRGLEDWCGIHARRGDYIIHEAHFPPVNMDYFKIAIPMMVEKGFTKFRVCSDGIEWCEDVLPVAFPHLQFEFSKGTHEWMDMSIIGSCGAIIIANSSFSWWAAFLNPNPNKIIVSPHNLSWYGKVNGVVDDAKRRGVEPCADLIPKEWIKIQFR